MKYKDLYEFIAIRVHRSGCNHTLSGVRDFIELHDLDHDHAEDLILELQEGGAHCDCEVLLNAMRSIDADIDL